MITNWNTAEVVVANKSGLITRSFHQVDIPDDGNFLQCWGEINGAEYCEIHKDTVGEVYINLNANGRNSHISVWKKPITHQ
jgi:hypothetical protein